MATHPRTEASSVTATRRNRRVDGVLVMKRTARIHAADAYVIGFDREYVVSVSSRLDRRQRGRIVRRAMRMIRIYAPNPVPTESFARQSR
jgi:hypothetical protein